jgi:hypothetical protein
MIQSARGGNLVRLLLAFGALVLLGLLDFLLLPIVAFAHVRLLSWGSTKLPATLWQLYEWTPPLCQWKSACAKNFV